MQFGSGCGGGGCEAPHLAAQALLQLSEVQSCCVGLLFVDVSTAFASMVRETILPTSLGKDAWARFLVSRGNPPDFAAEVMQVVAAIYDWPSAGLSAHALCVLQDFHMSTWFSTELLEDVVVTCRGCTAGNPVADLIYIASDACLERRLRQSLMEAGLTTDLPDADALRHFGLQVPPSVHTLSRIAYVDDGVIPIIAPASMIADRIRSTAIVTRTTYEQFGLSLNFAPGKSEVVIAFAGPCAQRARNDIFSNRNGVLTCDCFDGRPFDLRVVPRYKHLGGYVVASGDLSQEIGPKMAIVRQTARKLRRPFLRDPVIAPRKKAQVLQSLVLSRGLHLAGCWPLLRPREARALRRAVVDMLRPFVHSPSVTDRLSDDHIIESLGVLHPLRLLTLLRVNAAIRLAKQAPTQVLLLLYEARTSPRSWLRALEADLVHLSSASCLSELAGAPLSAWFALFRKHPVQAKQVVLKATLATNWVSTTEREHDREFTTYCTLCGEPASDRQALSVHMCRAHGVRRFVRSYVEGLTCLVCGLQFASRQRIIDHLAEKSAVCMHNYLLRYEPLPVEQVQALDLSGRTQYSRRQRLPGAHGVRIHGPFLLVYDLDGRPIRTRHPLGDNRRWNG